MSDVATPPLSSPLPPELAASGRLFGYRNYPVFGIAWLWRRTALAWTVIAVFAALMALSTAALDDAGAVAVWAPLWMFAAFATMVTAGPALATAVRHARLKPSLEKSGLVLAVLLGLVASYHADAGASAYIDRELRPKLEAPGKVHVVVRRPAESPFSPGRLFNTAILAAIYGSVGGGMALRAYFSEGRRLRELAQARALAAAQDQARQSELRLGVLQAQVEPHFLFNTLASVKALVRQDPVQAEVALDALVDYLRASIPQLRDDGAVLESSLGQQLDRCASYLALMRVRMGPRLTYSVEVEESLRSRPFPPLLLITLVENAIKHGIEPKPGPGHVDIRAELAGNELCVQVQDDGAGLGVGLGSGVGLANVREQLATRYGNRARFSLSSPGAGHGAIAEVVVPAEASA